MALINLRNALMTGKRLPYDAEVEYLESTGTQWIDTGIVPTNNHGFWVHFRAPKITPNNNSRIIGVQDSTTRWLMSVNTNGTNTFFGWNEAISNLGEYYSQDVVATLNFNNSRSAVIKGTTVKSSLAALGNITDRAALFANIRDGSVISGEMLIGRIYAVKISNSNSLVRDFIPVRKGTVGYLYDRVSGKLFGNAGTGDFALGPDVVPVEYIESHGTEYINTDYYAGTSTDVEVVYRIADPQPSTAIFGGRVNYYDRAFVIWNNVGGKYRFDYASTEQDNVEGPAVVTGDFVKLRKSAERNFVDGVETTSNSSKTFQCVSKAFLFALNTQGVAGWFVSAQVKSCEIRANNILVRKFLSVRVGTDATSWEGAMMDTLTRRIYRNAGTGAFAYGNDLRYPIPA